MPNDDAKKLFESSFQFYYLSLIQSRNQEEAVQQSLEIASKIVESIHNITEESVIESWSLEMYLKYNIGMEIKKTPIMSNGEISEWFDSHDLMGSFFWSRYQRYLLEIKKWPVESVRVIDESTSEILRMLGNPNNHIPFDKRGLVLGYVQSGKTANFTGLINKAYDLGYKLVIVLSGMHNDLRCQTQLRLEEEVVGSVFGEDGKPKGVAQILSNDTNHIISTWTTIDKDITSSSVGTISHINRPTLVVVKKNKKVLEALRNHLNYHKTLYNLDIPLLVIDDEADQASVDTSDSNKNEDPKTINSLIRQILEIFEQKAYVGYTATPFANLLINVSAETLEEGCDLYPKDFLVGLPKPVGYCGPEEFFNVFENEDFKRPSVIRSIPSEELEMLDSIKKKNDSDKFDQVPESMIDSILSYLIVIAIRNLRGQQKNHNSMLIHITRFKDVQSTIKNEIQDVFNYISNQILYNRYSELVSRMENIYKEDFVKTTLEWSETEEFHNWKEVHKEIKKVIDKILIMEINGNSEDALSYHKYKDEGLNVIAVGGDKLSRGLTLEGLSITYYYRNTLMYDTLMQMGRWFGYRTGYMDLCRVYTSNIIAEYFEHLAEAMVELRLEFERLSKMKVTPQEYAIKMLSHPKMLLTSRLKMKTAVPIVLNYHGKMQQTRLFDKDENFYVGNMLATTNLINRISHENFLTDDFGSGKTNYHMAKNVDVKIILDFLKEYKTSKRAETVDSNLLRNFIMSANQRNELINWTVTIVDGNENQKNKDEAFPVYLGEIKIKNAVTRGVNAHKYKYRHNGKVDIGAIVAGNQEFVDLNCEDLKGIPDKDQKRLKRPKENGMLLIYPLNPEVTVFKNLDVKFSKTLVPIGIAISFPGTVGTSHNKKSYIKNATVMSEIVEKGYGKS
ncbi:endonuclease [Brevibacillus laterosporus]|uniref:Z1 domain-containing protein n=1 Tax=Brevibacillus laterosporus TaxID=1465 RepID=UPI000BD80DA2|nr:Z1 domain-containing protein [Brevibacillus laterosporus]PCN43648.1 endonuclease [Brevibacillus laterosporus]